jgi:hypothetical protein
VILSILLFGLSASALLSKKIGTNCINLPLIICLGISSLGLLGFTNFLLSQITNSIYIHLIYNCLFLALAFFVTKQNALAFVKKSDMIAIGCWVLVSMISVAMTFLPISKPSELIDGPYVFKTWSLPVQIQALAMSYPPDNAIPAVVTEYLANDLSFKHERPLMPGQEFSNRPILMSLSALPLRYTLGSSEVDSSPIARFDYVGTSWPNSLSIVSDREFRIFLASAIPLNASLAAIVAWLILKFGGLHRRQSVKTLYLAILAFAILNPYLIFHTLFTWPKNVASVFIISSLYMLTYKKFMPNVLSGFLMAMAYWSHPMTLPFIGVTGLYILISNVRKKDFKAAIAVISVWSITTLLFISPWILWTNVRMGLPFDLISQNASVDESLIQQISARSNNLFSLLTPFQLNIQPFDPGPFLWSYFNNIWAPVGLMMLFTPIALANIPKTIPMHLVIVPVFSGLLITLLFSRPTTSINHGWQAVWPILITVGMHFLRTRMTLLRSILVLQLVINSMVLFSWILIATEINFL